MSASLRPPRRPRLLSGEEAHLWREVAKLVTPLRGRAVPKADPAGKAEPGTEAVPAKAQPAPIAGPPEKPTGTGSPALAGHPPPKRPLKLAELAPAAPPPLRARVPPPAFQPAGPAGPGLERRERRGLQRGTLPIEARIDLHGLTQAEAHAALVAFLTRARAAGQARVLVVTGKGGLAGGEALFAERGVLRRSVPHWLRGPDLRGLVLGFEEAARHHGGAGALYVRLKRR